MQTTRRVSNDELYVLGSHPAGLISRGETLGTFKGAAGRGAIVKRPIGRPLGP